MAARILVVAAVCALQMLLPQRRRVQPKARCDLVQHAGRDADVGDLERAAAPQSFERIVAGLGAKERHRARRHRRAAHDLAAVAMQAARHVDGHRRERLAIDAIDELRRRCRRWAAPGPHRTARRSPADGRREDRATAAPPRRPNCRPPRLHRPSARHARRAGPAAPASASPARCRAATKPSPPLLPGPHSTTTGRRAWCAVTASATARPAASIRSMPGTPAAIAAASARAISAQVRRARSSRGSRSRTEGS